MKDWKREPVNTYLEHDGLELKSARLSDEVYAATIDGMVIVCTDVVIVDRKARTLCLTRRSVKPMQGLWVIGGRLGNGVSVLEGIVKAVRRETGLEIAPERFRFVTINRYLWKDREQHPQECGCDSLCFLYSLELTAEELELMSKGLTPEEYEEGAGLRPFTRSELEEIARSEYVHPMLFDLFDRILRRICAA